MRDVDQDRLMSTLSGLARFGADSRGGITRLAYSKDDRRAQDWLLERVADMNLDVHEDAVGNLLLTRRGSDPDAAPVACGSHIDTVIEGGAFDGTVGVVGALEALRMLSDEKLKRSVTVVVFRCEESSRFGFSTAGSKLMVGKGSPEEFSRAPRKGDVTFTEALRQWGCDPGAWRDAIRASGSFHAFLELHIEQGRVLEQARRRIGIVHNIAAPTRFKVHVHGVADHSGATPMGLRHDALVTASKIVLDVQACAREEQENGTVATVGVLDVDPGSINVVPGGAVLWVDLRGVDEESIDRTFSEIKRRAISRGEEDDTDVTFEMLSRDSPVHLSDRLAACTKAICERHGISYMDMNSGAGHDSMNMAAIAPTSMIFIPCKDGVSHNPAEHADIEDIATGTRVLAEALEELANE